MKIISRWTLEDHEAEGNRDDLIVVQLSVRSLLQRHHIPVHL